MVGASVEAGKKKNKNNDAIEKPEFQCPECSGKLDQKNWKF